MSNRSDEREAELAEKSSRKPEKPRRELDASAVMRSIANASPDSLMLLDREGNIQFINRPAPTLTIEQVLGTKVFDYVSPDQHAAMRACFERVLATGEPSRYDNVFRPDDGSISFWESRVGAVRENEQITGLVVLASNVTERRDAAADRDLFFKLSLDLYCVADWKGYFRRLNPAFERTL
jgi:PAS domain S-box-containing protein